MADGGVTATLREMLDRAGFEAACTAAPIGTRSCDDATLLVGAIREVLKLAGDWESEGLRLDAEAYENCARAVRETIRAALAGKEAGDGPQVP